MQLNKLAFLRKKNNIIVFCIIFVLIGWSAYSIIILKEDQDRKKYNGARTELMKEKFQFYMEEYKKKYGEYPKISNRHPEKMPVEEMLKLWNNRNSK